MRCERAPTLGGHRVSARPSISKPRGRILGRHSNRVFNGSQQSRNIAELINSALTVLASTASLHYTPHSVPSRHRAVARLPLPPHQASSSRQSPLVTSHQHPHSARSITSHARYRDNSTSDIADPHSPPTLSLPVAFWNIALPSIPSVCLQYCIAGNKIETLGVAHIVFSLPVRSSTPVIIHYLSVTSIRRTAFLSIYLLLHSYS